MVLKVNGVDMLPYIEQKGIRGDIQINFTGDLAQLARVLYPEIHRRERNAARGNGL